MIISYICKNLTRLLYLLALLTVDYADDKVFHLPNKAMDLKTTLVMDIICGRRSIRDTVNTFNIPLKQLQSWIMEFIGDTKLNEFSAQFIILKDHNSVYQDYNQHAATLGDKTLIRDCINKTDFAVNPSLAEKYIAYDQVALQQKSASIVTDTVVHHHFGSLQMECRINPILDDNGDPGFLILSSYIDYSPANLDFVTVNKILHSGCAHLFIRKKSIILETKYGYISLAPRECECALYLMIGKNVKDIARLLALSPKTVENVVLNMQNKFSVNSKSHLLTALMDADFLNLL